MFNEFKRMAKSDNVKLKLKAEYIVVKNFSNCHEIKPFD